MIKQEQIEEMAKVMYGYTCGDTKCDKCKYPNNQKCISYWNAEVLYKAGYRKVLLYTEDGKAIDCIQYAQWQLIEGYTEREVKRARKETAEKIFEILYQWLDLENTEKLGFVTIQKFDFLRKFREIYKQFDVEIKEYL